MIVSFILPFSSAPEGSSNRHSRERCRASARITDLVTDSLGQKVRLDASVIGRTRKPFSLVYKSGSSEYPCLPHLCWCPIWTFCKIVKIKYLCFCPDVLFFRIAVAWYQCAYTGHSLNHGKLCLIVGFCHWEDSLTHRRITLHRR